MLLGLLALSLKTISGQVFVVGEKTATADISTDFSPTHVSLQDTPMTERGRRELVRNLEAEQGFAHRALPVSPSVTLRANGPISPGGADYKKLIYQKGEAAALGDRVIITSMEIKPDRIVLDLNGGPYVKHRFLRHVQLNDAPVTQVNDERASGSRITLIFEGRVPEISAPEVKALLEPVIDFGVKTSEQAYADTLPPMLKEAIAAHEVLVGMNHRMVLAALGAPESKMRDQPSGDANGGRYEEWIYGHVPQTIRFVRFVGDRVTVVEIAALGKPIDIHDKDEMAGYNSPEPTREVAMGDKAPDGAAEKTSSAPTLLKPGEAASAGSSNNKVQFPDDNKGGKSSPPSAAPPSNNLASLAQAH
ncbi:hypothetical protein [Granulicella sp. S190]|uniref:hypothetical protein n=1 Tax=Granulicella sp. S190 TaxID=1747226 RepID=UPI00131A650B|nr:hypothetical protein [Granulicella sp. S190]